MAMNLRILNLAADAGADLIVRVNAPRGAAFETVLRDAARRFVRNFGPEMLIVSTTVELSTEGRKRLDFTVSLPGGGLRYFAIFRD